MPHTNQQLFNRLVQITDLLERVVESQRTIIISGGRPGSASQVESLLTQLKSAIEQVRDKITPLASTAARQDTNTNKLIDIESLLAETGGFRITEWLEDIEADVDGIEGRLDTLIANNTADFIVNTAEMAVQSALIIAQLVLNAAIATANGILIGVGNSRLADVRDNTDPAAGSTIAEWLEDIEADVDGLEGRLDTLIGQTDNVQDMETRMWRFSFDYAAGFLVAYRYEWLTNNETFDVEMINLKLTSTGTKTVVFTVSYYRPDTGVAAILYDLGTISLSVNNNTVTGFLKFAKGEHRFVKGDRLRIESDVNLTNTQADVVQANLALGWHADGTTVNTHQSFGTAFTETSRVNEVVP